MYRRTAARTVVAVLAPVLFALQFFAPSGSFASAYTNGDAVAHARPGTIPSGTAPHDETVTCREAPGRTGAVVSFDKVLKWRENAPLVAV